MKRMIIILGILLEICFLSFYLIKYLAVEWGVDKLYLNEPRIFLLTAIVLITALIIQIIAGIYISRKKVSYKYIFIFSIIFNLTLLFVWNIGSNDLYTHIQRGRMVAHYGVSPYSVTYDSLSYDSFYEETKTVWSGQLSIYGPVFTLFGGLISYFAKDSLLAHILIFKIIYSVLTIFTGYFIYKITKSSMAAFLFSWSPLVIFEIQANNHFEIISIFPIVVAVYLLTSKVDWKRYIAAFTVLTLGTLTKYFGAVVYPFAILYALKTLKTIKEKLLFIFIGGTAQIILSGVLFLPFSENDNILSGFYALASGKFISPSLGILALYSLLEFFKFHKEVAQSIVQTAFKIYYVFLLVKSAVISKFSEKKTFIWTLMLAFAGFTLIYLNLILPWYTLTLFTLICIYYGVSKDKKYITFSYLLVIYSLLLYIRVK